jgi:hypothetical protein
MMTLSTLKQIIAVLTFTKENFREGNSIERSYRYAVQKVANQYNVAYQTIGDACRRRLELDSISEFFKLLNKWLHGNPEPLIQQIKMNTSKANYDNIAEFFSSSSSSLKLRNEFISGNNSIEYNVHISAKESKMLKALAELEEKDLIVYLNELVSKSVKNNFKEVTRSMLNT